MSSCNNSKNLKYKFFLFCSNSKIKNGKYLKFAPNVVFYKWLDFQNILTF